MWTSRTKLLQSTLKINQAIGFWARLHEELFRVAEFAQFTVTKQKNVYLHNSQYYAHIFEMTKMRADIIVSALTHTHF